MITQAPMVIAAFLLAFVAIGLASAVKLRSASPFVGGLVAVAVGFAVASSATDVSGKALMGLAEPKAELTVTDLKMSGWKISVGKTGWTAKNSRWFDGSTKWEGTLGPLDSSDVKRKKKELDGRIKYMDWIFYEAKFTIHEKYGHYRDPDMGDPPAKTTFVFSPPAGFEPTDLSVTKTAGELGWTVSEFQDGKFTLTTEGVVDKGTHKAKIEMTAYREETRSREQPAPEKPVVAPTKTPRLFGVPWYVYILGLGLICVPVCIYAYEEAERP